jgi:hypothetical protein
VEPTGNRAVPTRGRRNFTARRRVAAAGPDTTSSRPVILGSVGKAHRLPDLGRARACRSASDAMGGIARPSRGSVSVPLMGPGTPGAPGEHQVPLRAIGGRGRSWARTGVSSMASATGRPLAHGLGVVVAGVLVAVPVTLCRRGHAIVKLPVKRMFAALLRSTHTSMCKVAPLPVMVASKT